VLNSVNTKHTRRLLRDLYHRKGPGRNPLNPLAILKAQLLKHLLRIPSDRRLALRLKHDRRTATACDFKKHTPNHGLFTPFRHRLGKKTYNRIFNQQLRVLGECIEVELLTADSQFESQAVLDLLDSLKISHIIARRRLKSISSAPKPIIIERACAQRATSWRILIEFPPSCRGEHHRNLRRLYLRRRLECT